MKTNVTRPGRLPLASIHLLCLGVIAAACTLGVSGCDRPSTGPQLEGPSNQSAVEPSSASNSTVTSTASDSNDSTSTSYAPPNVSQKIKVKSDGETTAFSIKWMDDGAKMVDADEAEIARFNASPGKLKIKDPSDKVIGYIVGERGRWKVEDPSQEVEYFKLQQYDDGDWKLEDPNEQLIYKIKQRDYGFEIENAAEASLYKIKVKDEKTSLRNAADQTVLYTKDQLPAQAFVCLGFDEIKDLRIRVALLVVVAKHQ